MRGLEAKARVLGERAVTRVRGRVADALREQLGEAVRENGDGVAVEGRCAVRRMLADPALRWVAGLIR